VPSAEIPSEARYNVRQLTWYGVGGVVMGGFMFARRFLFWWPHPAGYLLWMAGTIDRLWFSFFLGWAFKWAISKYGGMQIYNASRKFFIGLVVGECLAAVFWSVIGLIYANKSIHKVTIGFLSSGF